MLRGGDVLVLMIIGGGFVRGDELFVVIFLDIMELFFCLFLLESDGDSCLVESGNWGFVIGVFIVFLILGCRLWLIRMNFKCLDVLMNVGCVCGFIWGKKYLSCI